MSLNSEDVIKTEDFFLIIKEKLINKGIPKIHIYAVMRILLEELEAMINNKEEIHMNNFGYLKVKTLKPKTSMNWVTKKLQKSSSRIVLRFHIYSKISQKLCSLIDIDKTFGNG